jgi:hypothetical protein
MQEISMKILNIYLLSILFTFIIMNLLSGMSGMPVKNIPLKPSNIHIEDGEYIRMFSYVGNEKSEEWHIVVRINTNDNKAEIFWQVLNLSQKQVLPSNYTNYNTWHYIVNLKTGSIVSSLYQNPLTNAKGLIRYTFNYDEEKGEIQSYTEIWDGYELKSSRPKMTVNKGSPIFDANSTYYIVRFLDIIAPGLVYLCEPDFLKEALPVTFNFVGREIIQTPAGEFKTIKIALIPADPFMARLLQSYTREGFIWIEDSPRRLLVKATSPFGYSLIEEISTIRKKGME